MQKLHLSRPALIARLPAEDSAGTTQYRTPGDRSPLDLSAFEAPDAEALHAVFETATSGVVLIGPAGAPPMFVVPPFDVERSGDFGTVRTEPLIELLTRPRTCGVFLLRLGGFTVGLFRGDTLIDSKTDQRFVKNRHRKGGQSQRRFERIREKQVHELFGKACETAREKLEPHRDAIEHVFLGGDRRTLLAFRKECPYFEGFGARLMRRVLPVAGDPRHASLGACPRAMWSSDVWIADQSGRHEDTPLG